MCFFDVAFVNIDQYSMQRKNEKNRGVAMRVREREEEGGKSEGREEKKVTGRRDRRMRVRVGKGER